MSGQILVDTSVWIDHFGQVRTPQVDFLRRTIPDDRLVVADLVLVEVLQRVRDDLRFARIRRDLAGFHTVAVMNPQMAMQSVDNYRFLRRLGVTVRGTIDCLIATYCIATGSALLHNDRDFEPFERHLGLVSVRL